MTKAKADPPRTSVSTVRTAHRRGHPARMADHQYLPRLRIQSGKWRLTGASTVSIDTIHRAYLCPAPGTRSGLSRLLRLKLRSRRPRKCKAFIEHRYGDSNPGFRTENPAS